MSDLKEYSGELLGTFILVLFGCGSVAAALLFEAFGSLLEVAIIWGIGVAIAIFSTRNICPAHLNPAVSIAMTLAGKLTPRKLPMYIVSQITGALIAGVLIYFIFGDGIELYEETNNIVRGSNDSFQSAIMFGEFFPNPGFSGVLKVSHLQAMTMEALGTFLLVFVIFRLTEKENQADNFTPVMIGLTVTILICLVAPFTQGGFNPARDFAPRLVAHFSGWGDAAFPPQPFSFFTVYILSPIIGGVIATYFHRLLIYNKK